MLKYENGEIVGRDDQVEAVLSAQGLQDDDKCWEPEDIDGGHHFDLMDLSNDFGGSAAFW